jgi:hypothetical protein
MGANPLLGQFEGVGPENRDFFGSKMATTPPPITIPTQLQQIQVHKITNIPVFYIALGLNDFDEGKSFTRASGRCVPSK